MESEGLDDPDTADFVSYGNRWTARLQQPWGFAVDRILVRGTGYSLLSFINSRQGRRPYTPVLLLTTIGKSSGQLRTKVLPYIQDGDALIVIASNGGGPSDPAWVSNLRSNPICWVRVKRASSPAIANIASGKDRDSRWAAASIAKPNIIRYQTRASTFGRESRSW